MEFMVLIILIGVAMIDGKLWRMMSEQRRHNQAVETTLAIMKEKALNRLTREGEGTKAED